MHSTLKIAALEWIPTSIGFCVSVLINTSILRIELKKRKSGSVDLVFASKYAKIFSLLTLIFGVTSGLSGAFLYIDGFCYFCYPLLYHSIALQGTFLGLYQLDRLYYCFSRNKVYSDHGYPFYLFVIMILWAGITLIASFISPFLSIDVSNGRCFLDSELIFHDSYNGRELSWTRLVYISISWQTWDLLTMLLFVGKVISIRHYVATNPAVWTRVMTILHRILIPTGSYEICIMFANIFNFIWSPIFWSLKDANSRSIWNAAVNVVNLLIVIAPSVAIFLMLEHNTKQYRNFLRCLSVSRIQYLCCFCCLSAIQREMDEMSDEKHLAQQQTNNEQKQSTTNVDETVYDTKDMSVKMTHSTCVDLSVSSKI